MKITILLLTLLSASIMSAEVDLYPMSSQIPGGLSAEETPMFVSFGWDDNAYVDGMVWSDTLFKDKKNKDGSPARGTYFITAGLASDHFREVGEQTKDGLKAAWKSVYDNGHEIGNHTFSHPNGGTVAGGDGSIAQNLSKDEWQAEMQKCMDSLSAIMGITQDEILGFRTPYLGVNQGDYDAQKAMGIKYDCSIQYGFGQGWDDHEEEGGSWNNSTSDPKTRAKLFWPFTLENGWKKTEPYIVKNGYAPDVKAPGQWIFTVYAYLKPSGVGSEITGFDGNMWSDRFSKDDFVKTLLYNFHLQRDGNKCPITINTHTDNYSEYSPGNFGQHAYQTEWPDRRLAIEEFLDSILQYDDVRVVPFKDVITWIKNPIPHSEYVAPTLSGDKESEDPVDPVDPEDPDPEDDVSISLQNQLMNQKEIAIVGAGANGISLRLPSGAYSLSLFSPQGRLIKTTSLSSTGGVVTTNLKANSLSSGIYFLQVNKNGAAVFQQQLRVK